MRFLVDECTGPAVADWLRGQSHDVVSAHESLRGQSDEAVLNAANSNRRILITNDKDFGEKIYREGRNHYGIILLRLEDERPVVKITALRSLLDTYNDEDFVKKFTVVTDSHIRFGGG